MMMAPALQQPRRRLEARDEKDPVSRHDLPDTGRRWHTGSLRARKRGGAPWVVLADGLLPVTIWRPEPCLGGHRGVAAGTARMNIAAGPEICQATSAPPVSCRVGAMDDSCSRRPEA